MTAAEWTYEKQKGLGLATEPFEFRWAEEDRTNHSFPYRYAIDSLNPMKMPPKLPPHAHSNGYASGVYA